MCPAKALTFGNTLISRKLIKLVMDKSGFRRFFCSCLFLSHSYQFVQIVSFFMNIGVIHKHLKISIMLCFRNLFRDRKCIHINGRIHLDNTTKEKSTERNIKIINIPTP